MKRSSSKSELEEIQLVGETILYDTFVKSAEFSKENSRRMTTMIESVIRSIAHKRMKHSDKKFTECAFSVASDLFTKMVFNYEILLAGAVPPEREMEFLFNPVSFVEMNRIDVVRYIEEKIRRLCSAGVTTMRLANTIIDLIKFASKVDIPGKRFHK